MKTGVSRMREAVSAKFASVAQLRRIRPRAPASDVRRDIAVDIDYYLVVDQCTDVVGR
jgi:hypothetical protein